MFSFLQKITVWDRDRVWVFFFLLHQATRGHQLSVLQFKSILTLPTREGNGTPLQYSCLENPMDGGAWWAAVHGVAKSWTRLSNFPFTFHFHALEKEMATHSSVLAWRIPGTGELGGLPSMGLNRVGHDWSDLAAAVSVLPGRDQQKFQQHTSCLNWDKQQHWHCMSGD